MKITSNLSAGLTVAILAASAGLVFGQQAPPAEPEPAKPAPDASPTKPAPQETPAPAPAKKEAKAPASPYVLGHKATDIDGKEHDLAEWKGQVVLIVNTASRCGYTTQYRELEKLYQASKAQGFVILAFPSGDFNNQEFGENKEIKEFCTGDSSQYKITFPLFAKTSVKGEKVHPLFKQLAEQPAPIGGDPKWNFTKWLVDRSGNVVARYETRIKPDNLDLTKKVAELLGSSAPAEAPAQPAK